MINQYMGVAPSTFRVVYLIQTAQSLGFWYIWIFWFQTSPYWDSIVPHKYAKRPQHIQSISHFGNVQSSFQLMKKREAPELGISLRAPETAASFQKKAYPIASIYGIFTYIYHTNQPNVGKHNIPCMDPMGILEHEILSLIIRPNVMMFAGQISWRPNRRLGIPQTVVMVRESSSKMFVQV